MKRILIALSLSLGFTAAAHAADTSTDLTICSGSQGGVYHSTATQITQAIPGRFSAAVLETNGSMDNLSRMVAGECTAAIVQADAYAKFARERPSVATTIDRAGTLHTEYVHMLCNADSGINDDGDLESKRPVVAIGEPGSGGWVTWKNWETEDKDYAEVTTVPLGGMIAAAKVADGAEVDCMILVSGVPSGVISKYDNRFGEDMVLVELQDWDFDDATDPRGNDLYRFVDIPSGTYPAHLQTGFFGSAVGTTAVDAILVINNALYEREDVYSALLEAYSIVR